MPQAHMPADAIGLPISREQVEAQIDILIDLLNALDTDADLEPDLTDATTDREDDDEREPSEDGEASLGWRNEGSQTGYWAGNSLVGIDLEDEHDGCEPEDDSEPDVDDEPTGGWSDCIDQLSRERMGVSFGGTNATGQLA